MKRILSAIALAAMAASASAQVTFSGGTDQAISGIFDPSGTVSAQTGGKRDATLSTSAGVLTATFLGFEAQDTDTYTFTAASGTMSNKTAVADVTKIFGNVAAGLLNFTFMDTFTGASVGNGGGGGGTGMFDTFMVFGTGTGTSFVPYTKGGLYDLVLGFNDSAQVDGDYDDFVVGLKVAAVPEPETYALLLAGLGAVGFIARRRRQLPLA
jgi:PEP-CTERM motif